MSRARSAIDRYRKANSTASEACGVPCAARSCVADPHPVSTGGTARAAPTWWCVPSKVTGGANWGDCSLLQSARRQQMHSSRRSKPGVGRGPAMSDDWRVPDDLADRIRRLDRTDA